MRYSLFLWSLGLMLCVGTLAAQTNYSCDFEDPTENEKWNLNIIGNPNWKPEDFPNRWYIGSGINNGGENSLYISADGGLTPSYKVGSLMVAARSIQLAEGEYELSFDWLAGSAAGNDILYVGWMPETVRTNSAKTGGMRPAEADPYLLVADVLTPPETDTLRGAWWKTTLFRFKVEAADVGVPHKLVFFWSCSENVSPTKGACIDNIQIMPKGACPEPEGLRITTKEGAVTLYWNGVSDQYDVKCYSQESEEWFYVDDIAADSVDLKNLPEGMCDFYVRSVCEEGHSRWVSISKLVYMPEVLCIDYLNLTDQNCWYKEPKSAGDFKRGKIDMGSDNMYSRHTIHMVRNEYDANTGNKLKTIPDGELASVRLGNWDVNYETERIEYTYTVDAEHASVLLLKYAVVLQEPDGHDENQQPRFELKVMKGANVLNECSQAIFRAGFDTKNDKTWHEIPVDGGSVWWKEWTTIGINLEEYDGEKLKVQVTTYDCSLEGHYGYAYFTLGCTNGEMEGIACGEIPTTEFIAPEGFNYKWYSLNPEQEFPDKTERIFPVNPDDTVTYYCDLIFPTNPKCYFTLSASAKPRFPVVDGRWNLSTDNCTNIVEFENLSRVLQVNQVTHDTIVETQRCEIVYWDFGDGETSAAYSPTHVFPIEGGRYEVNLQVGIANGLCMEDTTFILDLPDLRTTVDTIPTYRCFGTGVQLPGSGETVWQDGIYPDTIKSLIYPCRDSVNVYDVTFGQPSDVVIYDTICSGTRYFFDNKFFTETTDYTTPVMKNIYGCDSVATLHLKVYETLDVEMPAPEACADEAVIDLHYDILSGLATSYSLEFGNDAKAARFENMSGDLPASPLTVTFPEAVRPGRYAADMIFMDAACGNDTVPLILAVNYPSSIITQRWDNILFLQNEQYNGGYTFSAYQWYKDEEAIGGATASYLHVPGGLDMNAEYSVEVTRADDGVTAFTCPVTPYAVGGVTLTLQSNVVPEGGEVQMTSTLAGTAMLYDVSGVLLSRQAIVAGDNRMQVPAKAGYYLMQVELDNGQMHTYHVQVVR